MSVVVPFPALSTTVRRGRKPGLDRLGNTSHTAHAASSISWVRPADCDNCGRPTLATWRKRMQATLCGRCTVPGNIA
jgi:hypothetical protein